MTKPIIKIHDVETNEVIEREMTNQEFAAYQAAAQSFAAREAEATAKAAEKQAVLDKLGLTAEELAIALS
jgi:hypothetical protein